MRACSALRPVPVVISAAALVSASHVRAAGETLYDQPEFIGLSAALALGVFATTATFLHMAGRKASARRESALKGELNAMRARLDRAEVFLAAESQVTICWGSSYEEPDIEGDMSELMELTPQRRVLAFGSWLSPMIAQQLERAVERLRDRGEAFRLPLVTLKGRYLETEGRAVAGRVRAHAARGAVRRGARGGHGRICARGTPGAVPRARRGGHGGMAPAHAPGRRRPALGAQPAGGRVATRSHDGDGQGPGGR